MKACTCRPHTPGTPIRPLLPTCDPKSYIDFTTEPGHSGELIMCQPEKGVREEKTKRLNSNTGNSWLRTKVMVDRGFSSHPGMHLQCVGSVDPPGDAACAGQLVQFT